MIRIHQTTISKLMNSTINMERWCDCGEELPSTGVCWRCGKKY